MQLGLEWESLSLLCHLCALLNLSGDGTCDPDQGTAQNASWAQTKALCHGLKGLRPGASSLLIDNTEFVHRTTHLPQRNLSPKDNNTFMAFKHWPPCGNPQDWINGSALAEEASLVPSTRSEGLTASCNFISRKSNALFWNAQASVLMCIDIDIHSLQNQNKLGL